MATYDEFDGVWFTIQSIRLHQPEMRDDVSFLVIDNNPTGVAAQSLRDLANWIPNYRYIPFSGFNSTAVRDVLFREADTDIVLCVDSHILLEPGSLKALQDWFVEHPNSRDLIQGPLLYDDGVKIAGTHFGETWGAGMFGQWAVDSQIDEPDPQPFDIPMQGLGMFACRKAAWPGFNPRFRGFGGEEGYLHEKIRQNGGRALCHPKLRWVHRFNRPSGVPYSTQWEDRIRNYLIGWREIGWDTTPIEEHFGEFVGDGAADVLAHVQAQIAQPLHLFDAVFCLAEGDHSHDQAVDWRIEHATVPEDGVEGGARRVQMWRSAIEAAARRGYASVVVTEDEALTSRSALLLSSSGDLPAWNVWLPSPVITVSPSVGAAVHARAFERFLADVPDDPADSGAFLERFGDVYGYLSALVADGVWTTLNHPAWELRERPRLASDVEVSESDAGIVVNLPGTANPLFLNNTAAVILASVDGDRDVEAIAGVVSELFALQSDPVEHVAYCLAEMRAVGLLDAQRVGTAG